LLDEPSDGELILNGHVVTELSGPERSRLRNREVGFIFQAFNLIGDLSVAENVALPLVYAGLSAGERKERVSEALGSVDMTHRRNHYPRQLSGGQQQRVAVARALVARPAILLADEPTGNLDSANGKSVMDLLLKLHQGGASICVVTHHPGFAELAERSVHMMDGRIVSGNASSERDLQGSAV
jgi:putative ABC transport system ATP-binding protein